MIAELMRNYRKLIPMGVLVTLVVIAGGTDFFSREVHNLVRHTFAEFGSHMLPYAVHLLVGFLMLNVAWLLYSPLCAGVERVFCQSGASPRAKSLSIKLLKFFYWAIVVMLVLSITASEFLGRFALGFGTIGVALTFALQGVANDAICGLLLQFTRKVNEGDEVEIDGTKVKGTVANVGYLSTLVNTAEGVDHVPNRDIWSKTVRVLKPKKSLIIIPPGVDMSRGAKKE